MPAHHGDHGSLTQEFGPIKNIKVYDSMHYAEPRRWFQPLAPRQFYQNDTFYMERSERLPAWDELLFDLVYIAVIVELGTLDDHV